MGNFSYIPALQLSFRAAAAAGLSLLIAELFRLPFPIYSIISAVIVTDLDPIKTRKAGPPRLAGTVLGACLGAIIIGLGNQPGPWVVSIGILVSMLLSHLLHLRDAAKLSGYVCGIVLFEHGGQPWVYAFYRTAETIIGIGVAIMVSLVPRLFPAGREQPTAGGDVNPALKP